MHAQRARFFDRRKACAGCSGTDSRAAAIVTEGTVRTFTIVYMSAPGVKVPFVAAIVDGAGMRVRANLINVPAGPLDCRSGPAARWGKARQVREIGDT